MSKALWNTYVMLTVAVFISGCVHPPERQTGKGS